MTPEEYERIKEAEKEHLRTLRQLKQAVRALERQKRVTGAVEALTGGARRTLDEHAAAVDALALDAARHEARLDIALEATRDEAAPSQEQLDEAMQRARARELVRQMKQSLGGAPPDAAPPALPEKTVGKTGDADGPPRSRDDAPSAEGPAGNPTPPPGERPEKTIGRM